MSHDATQPTLPDRHESSLTQRLCGLGLVDLVAWAAFEAARDDAAPLSPTLRLTFALADRLRQRSILRLLDVAPRAPAFRQARAIYDPIAWEYFDDPPEPAVLREAVNDVLCERAQVADAQALWLWVAIAEAELEGYVVHLLRRHQMETAWARSVLERAAPELTSLSLAQRRAVCWYGIREGAAAFLRTRGDATQCVEAIVGEIRRQARWMLRHEPQALSWLPQSSWRQPIVLATFLARFPLGSRYWTELPTLEALASAIR